MTDSDINYIAIETESGVKGIFLFKEVEFPFHIPQHCIYCFAPTSNIKPYRQWQGGPSGIAEHKTYEFTLNLPTCPACPSKKHLAVPICPVIAVASFYNSITLQPILLEVEINNPQWAKAFAIQNNYQKDFDFQSVMFYLRGLRKEVPDKSSVSVLQTDSQASELLFIECTKVTKKSQKTLLRQRCETLSISFPQERIEAFLQKAGVRLAIANKCTMALFPLTVLTISGMVLSHKYISDNSVLGLLCMLLSGLFGYGTVISLYFSFHLRARIHGDHDWLLTK